jgi:hypothetical protein
MRYALIENGIVKNIIIWNGVSEYARSNELIQITDQICDIGYSYVDGNFIAPIEQIVDQPQE